MISRRRNLEEEEGKADEPMEVTDPADEINETYVESDGGIKRHKPLGMPVAAEYATSPPSTKVIFLTGAGPVMADKRGVRKFRSLIEHCIGLGGGPDPTEEELEELESMTMWNTLRDNTFWAGMAGARVVADNTDGRPPPSRL
ncbi:hypothetical protein JCM10295v2_005223 [Rhodotorula toruloides]